MIANKEAYKKIKELMEENMKLKNQIKLFKQSSQSTLLTPPKSTAKFSGVESFRLEKKGVRKSKKKLKRKKVDYLNPSILKKVK